MACGGSRRGRETGQCKVGVTTPATTELRSKRWNSFLVPKRTSGSRPPVEARERSTSGPTGWWLGIHNQSCTFLTGRRFESGAASSLRGSGEGALGCFCSNAIPFLCVLRASCASFAPRSSIWRGIDSFHPKFRASTGKMRWGAKGGTRGRAAISETSTDPRLATQFMREP